MRKDVITAFLWGLVIPVALMALYPKMETEEKSSASEEEETAAAVISTEAGTQLDSESKVWIETETGELMKLSLEEYLTGVVLAEMPVDFEPEALKAQAVVARTYACKRMEHSRHSRASLCTDPACCQGYRNPEEYLKTGGSESGLKRVQDAVRQTDHMVLVYEGELIDATYFSCSGGMTEDAVEVWGQDVPYLQSVESPGEEIAPRYTEMIRLSRSEFAQKFSCDSDVPFEQWFGTVSYTRGGGVDQMEIGGTVYSGKDLREELGLRSTKFEIYEENDEIVIETKGFGHRVGMSQYGAQAMALEGTQWEDILTHYYQGSHLTEYKK